MSRENQADYDAPTNLRKPLEKLLKEIHGASRAFALYPAGHSALEKAVNTAYRSFQKIFWLKTSICLEIWGPEVTVEGFYFRANEFAADLLWDLDSFRVRSLVFTDSLTEEDLYHFSSFLGGRQRDASGDLQALLRSKGINSIEVNTRSRVSGPASEDEAHLSVLSGKIRELLKEKPEALTDFFTAEGELDEETTTKIFGFGIREEIARKLVSENVESLPDDQSSQILKAVLSDLKSTDLTQKRRTEILKDMIATFTSGREQATFLRPLLDDFLSAGVSKQELLELLNPEAVKRWNLRDESERILHCLTDVTQKPAPAEEFKGLIKGFVSTENWSELAELLDSLRQILEKGTKEQRQRVCEYLTGVVDAVSNNTPETFLKSLAGHCRNIYLHAPSKASRRLLVEFARELILLGDFALAKEVLSVLPDEANSKDPDTRSQNEEILSEIVDQTVVERLISEISKGKSETSKQAMDLIFALRHREIFKGLTEIFTSSKKSLRLNCLKALKSGGDDALWACDLLLRDRQLLKATCPDGYLEKEKWYKVRNAIFVIGGLGNPEGINTLLRWSECTDPRVGHELATAAEKIGGEQAIKLLMILADNKHPKVRNRAIVALGQIAKAADAGDLITISQKYPDSFPTLVKVLGRLAGEASRDFLFSILENEKYLKEQGLSKKEISDLRVLTLRAVAQIGDEASLSRLREYRDRKETTGILLKKRDELQATAASLVNQIEGKSPEPAPEVTSEQ